MNATTPAPSLPGREGPGPAGDLCLRPGGDAAAPAGPAGSDPVSRPTGTEASLRDHGPGASPAPPPRPAAVPSAPRAERPASEAADRVQAHTVAKAVAVRPGAPAAAPGARIVVRAGSRADAPGGSVATVGAQSPPQAIRFAALGDSLTEGVGDPVPGGWRGWAALLAEALAPDGARLLNLARSGALSRDVAECQLPEARAHRPHLASVLVGGNDTLRASFDIGQIAARLDTVLATLRADGAVLLTACLPDPGRLLGLPSSLARPLARRMRAVNTVVHTLSDRYGALHLHVEGQPWLADRAALSVDRLHPSQLGHRLIAREFHSLLTAAGVATGAPPAAVPDGAPPSRTAAVWWMATRGTRWVIDRCTDLLPDLLRLAVLESRHRVLGSDHLLDLRAHRATRAALEAVTAAAASPVPLTGPATMA